MRNPREMLRRLNELNSEIPASEIRAATDALRSRWPWFPPDAVPVLDGHRADALALSAQIVEAIAEARALDYGENVPGGIAPEVFRAAAAALRDARPWHEVPTIEGHDPIVLAAASHMVGGEE